MAWWDAWWGSLVGWLGGVAWWCGSVGWLGGGVKTTFTTAT